MQITLPDSTTYTYTLAAAPTRLFRCRGDGSYKVDVLEHVQDDMYALAFSQECRWNLRMSSALFVSEPVCLVYPDDETVACASGCPASLPMILTT